ncbi:MAG: hypothetical protein AAFN79_00415 [Pseudomonadota bacterium]
MIRALAIAAAFFGTTAASAAGVYENPVPLSEMLKRGYQIAAVLAPPLVTPDMDLGDGRANAIKRNGINRVQREIYLQNGSRAAVCFWDTHRAKAGCYDLTAGEK